MKLLTKIINKKGHVVLICKQDKFFGLYKKTVEFIATKEYPKGYWNWRQSPNNKEVDELTSYDLDNLCNLNKIN